MPDHYVDAFLVTDPDLVREMKALREAMPGAHRDEVWEGIYVVSPGAGVHHQWIVGELSAACREAGRGLGARAFPGLNVSDRVAGWLGNYREPDVAVYLPDNPATFYKAHVVGGPDLAVEILSEGDQARRKLGFYASVGTREVLLIDWEEGILELFRLAGDKLELAGRSDLGGVPLASGVLPLSFRFEPGAGRAVLLVERADGGPTWRI